MRAGAAEGLEVWRADDRASEPRLILPADPGHGRRAGLDPRCAKRFSGRFWSTTTFRTPDEAVALANNTRYGLAASVWTENVNRALEVASRIKAGVVWINSTNLFDAASGFGGYRESGFGREGGREGLYEYRVADARAASPIRQGAGAERLPGTAPADEGAAGIDRTAKLYVGGKQARPDSGSSYAVLDPKGREVGLAGLGSRKDIRNAVEAAAKAVVLGAGDRAQSGAGALLRRRKSRAPAPTSSPAG